MQLPAVEGLRASKLSHSLGVHRMTCQRIVKLKTSDDATPHLLTQIPGVTGLQEFLDALIAAGVSKEVLSGAHEAIDSFATFLNCIGLSQTKLATALSLHYESTDPEKRLQRRTKLFDAAASLMGQSMESTISIMAFKNHPSEAFNFEQIAIRGYAGISASHSAMPIRLPINAAFSDFRKVEGSEAAREPQSLIDAFCTTPLPTIDARMIKEENLAHIINPEHIPDGELFDCFASQQSMWKIDKPGMHKSIWLYNDYPSRSCTFDVYMPEGIALHNSFSADCHLWGTSLLAPPEDLWMTRFSTQLEYIPLGRGISESDSPFYTCHKELTEHMFNIKGWNPDEFFGFRCQMTMPVWRSGICLVIEEH